MSGNAELSGQDIMRQNMAAFESGEELPHNEEMATASDPSPEPIEEEVEDTLVDEYPEEVAESDEELESDDARHMSKEDWVASGKDPDTYLTPDEFKRVGALRGETNLSLAKKFAQQESMMKDILANQNKSISDAKEKERGKVLAELKQQQAEAIEFSDTEKAIEIERKIASHDPIEKPVDNAQQVDIGVKEWHSKNNDWYGVHSDASGLLDVELRRAQAKQIPFEEAIIPAMAKVKRQFNYLFDDEPPPKQENKKAVAPRPTAVSEKSRKAAKPAAKKRSFSELDSSMQGFARKAAKASGLSEQKYMEQM